MEMALPKPHLKTYSKRVFKGSHEPPQKRQRIEPSDLLEEEEDDNILVFPLKKKSTISDYFRPTPPRSTHSTPQPPTTNSGQVVEYTPPATPPSSPPFKNLFLDAVRSKTYPRRRLISNRVQLHQPEMSSGSQGKPTDRERHLQELEIERKLREEGSFVPGHPSPVRFIGEIMDKEEKIATMERREAAKYKAERKEVHGFFREEFGIDMSLPGDEDSEANARRERSISISATSDPIPIPGTSGAEEIAASKRQKISAGPKPTKYTQQVIDVGQPMPVAKPCPTCRFVYNHLVESDCRAHAIRHDEVLLGIAAPRRLNVLVKHKLVVDEHGVETWMAVIHRSNSFDYKQLAEQVLDMVDEELGCSKTNSEQLWSYVPRAGAKKDAAKKSKTKQVKAKRRKTTKRLTVKKSSHKFGLESFKIVLLVKDGRIIGCLLAESIRKGYEVRRGQVLEDGCGPVPPIVPMEELFTSELEHECFLGINKIWIHKEHRHQGHGGRLVDLAREKFICGFTVGKSQTAFTEVSFDGSSFAEHYMKDSQVTKKGEGEEDIEPYLWLSYDEEQDV